MKMKCKPVSKSQRKFLKELAEVSIEAALGGAYTVSYRMLSGVCWEEFLNALEYKFGTRKLSKLCTCRYEKAISFITDWFPEDSTMELSCELESAFERFIYRIVDDIPKDSPAYQEIMEGFINAIRTGSEGLE